MKRLFLCFSLTVFCVSLAWAQGEVNPMIVEDSLIIAKVPMRSGSTADIHAKIYENIKPECLVNPGNTILAIPGMAQTANSWRNFAYAVLTAYQDKVWDGAALTGNICRFVALDMPGHGRSSFPTGSLLFGDLVIEDYTGAIFAAMDRLQEINIKPTILIGHSLGGLQVEMMQDALVKMGTTLRRIYDIRNVIAISPAVPGGFPWTATEDPAGLAAFQKFVYLDPKFGMYLYLDYAAWMNFLFRGANGLLPPAAPIPDEVLGRGYISPEPLSVLLQLANYGPLRRPTVAPGIFTPANGTMFQMIVYENDALVRPADNELVYRHLTYSETKSRFILVKGIESVHNMHVSDPALLLNKITGLIEIPFIVTEEP